MVPDPEPPRAPGAMSSVPPAGMSTPATTPPTSAPPDRPRPPRSRARWRRLLAPALLEAGLIMLGVILAFAADEWRRAREDRSHARAAAIAIGTELRSNRAAVESARAYHNSIIESLRRRSSDQPPSMAMFPRGFVAPAPLASAAWQTASETGALEHLPHDVVLTLSGAYGAQGRYERQAEVVGGLIYGELYRGGADGIVANYRNLGHLISAFLYREVQLIEMYDATLPVLAPITTSP